MVGDNIVKDIGGGLRAGFITCWVVAPLGVLLEAPFDPEEVCDFA
jgi:FMN phosphatase YigB (HAD superfamily)